MSPWLTWLFFVPLHPFNPLLIEALTKLSREVAHFWLYRQWIFVIVGCVDDHKQATSTFYPRHISPDFQLSLV
jgi:hypothetical protein